jgi:pimeloyl-ACP methyl ester carboxylesterase
MQGNRTFAKRLRRIFLWGTAAFILLWLVGSFIAVWILTGRPHRLSPESASLVPFPNLEEHRLRTDDGVDLGAWLIRQGGVRPSVLLLHGNRSSRSSFAKVMPFLAQAGFGVMAISMRAHGDSTGKTNDFGLSARQDVIAAVSFLKRECPGRPIVIVGESLGAAAALFAAKDCAGDVKGYFFAAPYGSLDSAVWNRCACHLFPPLSQAAYAGLRLWAPAFLPVSTKEIAPAEHLLDVPETVPVTIFASEEDRYARIEEVRSMVGKIRSHARLIAVRGGDHTRFLVQHGAEYRKTLLELLDQVERGR